MVMVLATTIMKKKNSFLVYVLLFGFNCYFLTCICHSIRESQPGNILANYNLPSIVFSTLAWANTLPFKSLIFAK